MLKYFLIIVRPTATLDTFVVSLDMDHLLSIVRTRSVCPVSQ